MKKLFLILLKNDLRGISRDPMSFFIALLPLLLALLFRFLIPWITDLLRPLLDLSGLDSLWLGFLIMAGPIMFGWVGGILLLDEKDQNLSPVLLVTPAPTVLRLAVKSIFPALSALPGTFLIILISGMAPPYLKEYWLVAVLAALQAPLMTLLIYGVASSKLQGITFAKALTLLYMPPLLVPFFASPLVHLSALSPPYWTLGAFRAAVEGTRGFWFFFLGGIVYSLLLLTLLFRMAKRKLLRG